MAYIFYDIETTGLNSRFDQILQFAAIRTDHEFIELDRFEIRCRLLPYIVPSPEAILINGITVEQFTNSNYPSHHEMVCFIHKKLTEWGPAIFIGHNSFSFDKEFLRHSFFKSLLYPYLTNSNNNCRFDSLKLARAVNIFAPNSIKIPLNDIGTPTFKLAELARVNGFKNMKAHDALGDVEAVIHLCKQISQNAEEVWSDFNRFSKKSSAADFVENNELFALTEFIKSYEYTWLVTCIGQNPDYSSEMLVFDLSNDPEALSSLDEDQLRGRFTATSRPVRGVKNQ